MGPEWLSEAFDKLDKYEEYRVNKSDVEWYDWKAGSINQPTLTRVVNPGLKPRKDI